MCAGYMRARLKAKSKNHYSLCLFLKFSYSEIRGNKSGFFVVVVLDDLSCIDVLLTYFYLNCSMLLFLTQDIIGKRGILAFLCAFLTIPVFGLLAFSMVYPLVATFWLGITYSFAAVSYYRLLACITYI